MNETGSLRAVHVRSAKPDDVPALLEMKRELQVASEAEFALRATVNDWLRDGFGQRAQFTAFVAENETVVVGMITCSERYYTGWAGSTLFIQDLFVAPAWRRQGVGRRLLAQAAVHAFDRKCSVIELTVRKDNPVRRLYRRSGFDRVNDCVTYVAGAMAISVLAGSSQEASRSILKRTSND